MKKYIYMAVAAIAALSSCTPDGSIATKATFEKDGDAATGSTFSAYYPADLYDGTTATLPATQDYEAGKISNLPMYAESTDHNLTFKNLCGVLAITVNSSDFSSVNSIEVKSDKQMNGAFTASADGTLAFTSKTLEAADKMVTLNFASAKTISSSETFYIAVPANAAHNFIIKVTGNSKTKAMATKAASGINVERNTIYSITFSENAIQLWADGPYFATCNLGATNPGDYGNYYAWGETTTKSTYNWSTYTLCSGSETTMTKYCTNSSYGTVDNKTVLESGDDAATANWGNNWRMPTGDELVNGTNCLYKMSSTWTAQNSHNGRQFTGSNGNSIFLPATGYYHDSALDGQNEYCYYWSSSLNLSNTRQAYRLNFDNESVTIGGLSRYHGFPIRPVLSE